MEDPNTILDKLKRFWSWNGWRLMDTSEDMKIDREIVMSAVKKHGIMTKFAS